MVTDTDPVVRGKKSPSKLQNDFFRQFIENIDTSRAAKRGGFKRGGFPIWTCPSFFVLFCPFSDFPDFSGIFPICAGMVRDFPDLSFSSFSAY